METNLVKTNSLAYKQEVFKKLTAFIGDGTSNGRGSVTANRQALNIIEVQAIDYLLQQNDGIIYLDKPKGDIKNLSPNDKPGRYRIKETHIVDAGKLLQFFEVQISDILRGKPNVTA